MNSTILLNQVPPPTFTDYTLNRRTVHPQDTGALSAQGEYHDSSPGSWSTRPFDTSTDTDGFNSQQGYLHSTSDTKLNTSFNGVAGRFQLRNTLDSSSGQNGSFARDMSMADTQHAIQHASRHEHVQPKESGEGDQSSSRENGPPAEHGSKEATSHLSNSQDAYLTVSSEDTAPSAVTCPISCETRISMILCGEVITYDLKGIDSDPRVIIELLKVTKSERANYMVVAACYRRAGNPQSAKAVLLSMIDEFKKRDGIAKGYQPVFLMLSGCEADLAKMAQTNNKDLSVVAGYHAAAKEWLQKVFGTTETKTIEKMKSKVPEKHPLPTRPRAFSNSKPGPVFDAEKSRIEREVQSLRTRMANHTTHLFELRASKRKLEEDIVYERNLRRKLQRELENTEKERDAAKKMERYALIQVKQEVASRRNAEARLESLLKDKEN
ncbi:hypothetical protein CPB84DRAFT_1781459 [Gymnopilus junonius]|uniref:Uncharacterized protein n=1 Tax=Gymnopilus junonius TaxID=109634 RepID=A0A9P5NL34_GYMJU|nr:hypothetical protein CPB84DRAFT_1781459 [Gymnopilus junonius]